jgi:hypothetical protein
MRQELVKELAAAINDAVREALEEAADKLEENEHLEGCTESCCIDGCLVNDPAGFLRARAGEPCQER